MNGSPWEVWEPAAGPQLDAWVAQAEGRLVERRTNPLTGESGFFVIEDGMPKAVPPYSTDEALARPIMEREGIVTGYVVDSFWIPATMYIAWRPRPGTHNMRDAQGPVRMAESEVAAGMMKYVELKLGDVWKEMGRSARNASTR